MKLIVLKNNLVEALRAVERAVGLNANLAILKSILIKVSDGKIVVTATDLELAITHTLTGKVIECGETAVPFGIFNNVVKNLNSDRVTLEGSERKLLVTTDNYEATIQTQEASEFPIIPSIQDTSRSLSLPSSLLHDALQSAVIATQYSDIRPEISGVYMRHHEGRFLLVATDSFRLAERALNQKQIHSTLEALEVIVPLKTIEEVLRVLGGEDEDVAIFLDGNQILFATPSNQIISRLVDGRFPDYQAIIPKQTAHEALIGREEFVSAIKLVSAFSGRSSDLTITVGDNKKFLELYSGDSAVGENRYRVSTKLKGDKFSIVFNWRYLLDGLKIYQGEEITLGVNAPDRPATVRCASEPNLIYILMPIKG